MSALLNPCWALADDGLAARFTAALLTWFSAAVSASTSLENAGLLAARLFRLATWLWMFFSCEAIALADAPVVGSLVRLVRDAPSFWIWAHGRAWADEDEADGAAELLVAGFVAGELLLVPPPPELHAPRSAEPAITRTALRRQASLGCDCMVIPPCFPGPQPRTSPGTG